MLTEWQVLLRGAGGRKGCVATITLGVHLGGPHQQLWMHTHVRMPAHVLAGMCLLKNLTC